ncbi:unnamed protein product [Dimorphilus gyrociliatus]|uniref:Uncharacterized protein n=1 Tax=Dimorphilus gyrociliatus TaxID=2664684 RepID=A0A7I8WBM3_9ANNE|nr:unnamed protein product [Dimorphilus gyrociliatus]
MKFCKRSTKINSLWLWWYAFACIGIETYLVYRAVKRCTSYNEHDWNEVKSDKPVGQLYTYIALIVLSVMFVPFLVVTALFPSGNLANDGVRLGKEAIFVHNTQDVTLGIRSRGRILWRHLAPICHVCHAASAYCLFFPEMILKAEEIKHGLAPKETIWESSLDTLFEKNNEVRSGIKIYNY